MMRSAAQFRYFAAIFTAFSVSRVAYIHLFWFCAQADERAEREWSSGGDGEQLVGADAATSLLVSSSSDGDMLLQV